jgi:hypothetical protein
MTDTYMGYTVQQLRDKYEICYETGKLKHKTGIHAGKYVGGINQRHGYVNTSLRKGDGKVGSAPVHRLVWAIHTGKVPDQKLVIDHIDGNKTNNHPSNLRLLSVKENFQTIAKRKPKRKLAYIPTKTEGVKVCRRTGKYVATAEGQILLETYSEDEAKYARWDWEFDNIKTC